MLSQETTLSERLSTVEVSKRAPEATAKSSSNTKVAVEQTSAPPLPAKLTLKKLVPLLRRELAANQEDQGARQEHVYATCKRLLGSYDASCGDWKRYQTWDSSKSYTRNLIYDKEGLFALILLCWNPDVASPVHAHSESECFFRVIEGTTFEALYEWPEKAQSDEGELVLKARTEFNAGEVSFVNDSRGIHAVGCSHGKRAVTLHCYVPGYQTSKCWRSTKCDDTFTGHMIYDTVNGKRLAHGK